MTFPVDLLADVSQEQLEKSAHEYMNTLLYSNPDTPERLTLPDSTQVTISVSNVGFTPLYGQSDKRRVLARFSSSNTMVAMALYLLDRWWTVEDILRTADPARRGLLPVDTVGERIVLYILNRYVYREKERSSEETPFLCHEEKDHAKILWDDGEAVGFYSVKPAGSLYNPFSSGTYQLPVMDSIFVRKGHRGKGSGLLMLKDFVLSFPEDSLGLKYPLSQSMYQVCKKYLHQYPESTDLLWEVKRTGGPHQRTNIASKIQVMDLSVVSKNLPFTEESHVIQEVTDRDEWESSITRGIKAPESTLESTEETTLLGTTKAAESPVTDGRLVGSRQSKEEELTEDLSGKNIRMEHIAAGAGEDQASLQQESETLHPQTEAVFNHQGGGEDTSTAAPVAEEALGSNHAHRDRFNVPPAPGDPREEDPAGLLLSEEVCELQTEGETLQRGDQAHVWRRTTAVSTTITVDRRYTQQSQKEDEEADEEETLPQVAVAGVTDADPGETAERSDDARALEEPGKEERQQLEDEELNDEEPTEKGEEFGVKTTVPEEISAERPETAEQKLSAEGAELQEEHGSDRPSEDEEPPVVQRRSHRDRRKVPPTPKSTKQRQHRGEGTHRQEEELEGGRSSGRTAAEENQAENQNQEEQDRSVDGTREEPSTTELLAVVEDGGAEESEENVLTSAEGRRESKEAETKERAAETELEKEELPDDGAGERDVGTAADVGPPQHDQTKDGEIPTLQHASVVLVDLKTASNHLSAMLASETSEVQRLDSETEALEPEAAERMEEKPEASSSEGTQEQNDAKEASANEGKEESSHQKHEEEEEAPCVQAIHLRSGRKIVWTRDQDHEAELVSAETKEEKQADEEQPAERTRERRSGGEAAEHLLQPLAEASERNISGEDEAEEGKQRAVPPQVDEGPVALAEDQQNPEDTSGASGEKQQEEEEDPQGSDLQRLTVVLVDLGSSSQTQDGRRAACGQVDEEQPAAEMEERNRKEALKEAEEPEEPADVPGEASDVPEEAVTTQAPQSVEGEGVSAEEEVPVVERRTWRSGGRSGPKRRSAAATAQRKRAHRNGESEERGAEEARPDLEEKLGEEGEVKEKEDGVAAAGKEDLLQLHSKEDEETSREGPSMIARKTKRSSPAKSRGKSKKSRMQCKSEEEPSESVDQEEEEPEAEDREMDVVSEGALTEAGSDAPSNQREENCLREPSSLLLPVVLGDADEEEAATPEAGSHGNGLKATPGTNPPEHYVEEKTPLETSSDPEEVAVMKKKDEGSGGAGGEEEELAEEETTRMEKGMKTDGAGDSQPAESENSNDGTRALDAGADVNGMDTVTAETDVESPAAAPEEDHQAEGDAGVSEVLGGQEPSGSTGAKPPEVSHTDENLGSDLVTVETEEDRVRSSELNADEDEEASSSEEEEEEEEEEALSGDDGESIVVMGKKVLRGRTVPAVVFTPRRKRRRADTTPTRQSKRRSRV